MQKAGVDATPVNQCMQSDEAAQLQHQYYLKTQALNPPHKYVPWILINGQHNDDLQNKASNDLFGLACEMLQDKPSACQSATH